MLCPSRHRLSIVTGISHSGMTTGCHALVLPIRVRQRCRSRPTSLSCTILTLLIDCTITQHRNVQLPRDDWSRCHPLLPTTKNLSCHPLAFPRCVTLRLLADRDSFLNVMQLESYVHRMPEPRAINEPAMPISDKVDSDLDRKKGKQPPESTTRILS